MFLKTDSGTAYIHNFDSLDSEKEIVLFIPGAGMDHRVADLISPNPNIFNKVLSIDLPGHGGSTPTGAKSIQEYANFISNCIKEIDLSGIHLCGHSMGGLVAMELAASNSKLFKSIALFNCQYPLFVGSALLDGSSTSEFFCVTKTIFFSFFITSLRALIDLSLPTNNGITIFGKTTMSLKGNSGKLNFISII